MSRKSLKEKANEFARPGSSTLYISPEPALREENLVRNWIRTLVNKKRKNTRIKPKNNGKKKREYQQHRIFTGLLTSIH